MFKLEDVNCVTLLTKSPHVFVVNPERGIKDLPAFVATARKAKGKLNYGSPGYGSTTHLDVELLLQAEDIDVLHVPYQDGSAAMNALPSGEVQLLSVEISAALPLQQRVRIAAIMAEKRSPLLPDVPTTVELGYPNVVASSMYGVIAPPGTPRRHHGPVSCRRATGAGHAPGAGPTAAPGPDAVAVHRGRVPRTDAGGGLSAAQGWAGRSSSAYHGAIRFASSIPGTLHACAFS